MSCSLVSASSAACTATEASATREASFSNPAPKQAGWGQAQKKNKPNRANALWDLAALEASFSSSVPHRELGVERKKKSKIKGTELTLELPLLGQGIDPGGLGCLEGLVQGALCQHMRALLLT